jgi:Tn3 transposase DDE domain
MEILVCAVSLMREGRAANQVAAIILWNTVYLQRAVDRLRKQGIEPGPDDLAHLSPLGWEHI